MVIIAVVLLSAVAEPSAVDVRFIGNSAFELSDGRSTILLDFPYKSGAFGYMSFAPVEVHRRVNALCLFTHRHADHFEPESIADVGCAVAGPADVQAAVSESLRAGAGPVWHFGGARIQCIPTAHGNVEHCSYLISWHGADIFVSGDIDNLEGLDQVEEQLDVALLPSWLVSAVEPGSVASQTRVVIHHHAPGEDVRGCPGCVVPSQGDTFTVVGDSPGATSPESAEEASGLGGSNPLVRYR